MMMTRSSAREKGIPTKVENMGRINYDPYIYDKKVIEYIRFLHEKVQKYESICPGWSDQNTNKLMAWNNHQDSGDNIGDAPIIKNGSAPGFVLSDDGIPITTAMLSTSLSPIESALIAGVSYKSLETPSGFTNKVAASLSSLQPNLYSVGRGPGLVQTDQTLITEADNLSSPSLWMRPSSSGDCAIRNDMLHEHEELTIDEGTISVSCAYSQGILNNLSIALQNSGIDLSQASISVQINLGRKAGWSPIPSFKYGKHKVPISGQPGQTKASKKDYFIRKSLF